VNAAGELLLSLGEEQIRQPRPALYQEIGGERREVQGRYVVSAGGRVGFAVGDYDPRLPLLIDPVLAYSTFLGGLQDDSGTGIAVDAAGNAYVTGSTQSTNFPTANAFQNTIA
jgi:Beta-propeller repeat